MASTPITDHFDRLVGPAAAHYAVYPAGGTGPSGMVHRVRPTPGRPWTTIYTDGMSARALPEPDDGLPLEDHHVELVVGCPTGWFSDDDDGGPVDMTGEDEGDWLIELVQWMMELPWRIDYPVYAGLVLPNGEPPEPYSDAVRFCAVLLAPVASLPEDAQDVEVADSRVRLLSLVLLDAHELAFAHTHGIDALYERLDAAGIFERVDPERESAVDVAEG